MEIRAMEINKIVIKTTEKPISSNTLIDLLDTSHSIEQIAFMGPKIFDSSELQQLLDICKARNIRVIFGDLQPLTPEQMDFLTDPTYLTAVNILDTDPQLPKLQKLQSSKKSNHPFINIIKESNKATPQDGLSYEHFNFFDQANDIDHIECLNLLQEPLINYDGTLIGCWNNPDEKTPVNVCNTGIQKALNHCFVNKMLHMLKTGKVNMKCPCARCSVFMALLWKNAKLDLQKLADRK